MHIQLLVLASLFAGFTQLKDATARIISVDPITLYYDIRIPYIIEIKGGTIAGLVGKPVIWAFKHAHIPYELSPLPIRRQLHYLEHSYDRFCLMGWYRNKEREEMGNYSHFVYHDSVRIGVARKDNIRLSSGGTIEQTLSIPLLKVLVKKGYSYGPFLDKKFPTYNPIFEVTTGSNKTMLKMIHAGRADLLFLAKEEADALIPESDLPQEDFSYITFTDMPRGYKRYLLCSKNVEPEIIHLLTKQLVRYHKQHSN